MSNKNFKPEDFVLKGETTNPAEAVLERHNIVSEFSLQEVEDHKQDLLRAEKELDAQAKVCKATLDNIDRNHPKIKKMSKEEMHHVWMYKENLDVKEKAEDKLKLVREQLEQYNELIDMVYEKFGFVKTDVTTIENVEAEGDTKE